MIGQLLLGLNISTIVIILAKICDCCISIILAISIKRKSKYVLNSLFSMSLLGWATYIGTDAILYQIAPISLFFFKLASVLRDVGMIGISLVPLGYILAAFLLKDGEEITFQRKKKRVILAFIVDFIIILGVILNDSIVVYIQGTKTPIDPTTLPPMVPYSVNFDSVTIKGQIAYIFYMSYCIWYFAAVYLMFSIQKGESGRERRRARYIMFGMLMIPVGILYYVLIGPNVPTAIYPIIDFLGHLIWTSSPILIFLGVRIQMHVPGETAA
ncbi:MAG TPA: hypothetical protein VKM55_22590 [Candidatus Lokiarchaeia archaeon]|nr:hypothetical protein [Candidatus Lokiarchaeia archaeon]